MITYTTPSGYVGNTVERNSSGKYNDISVYIHCMCMCVGTKAPKTTIPEDSVIFPDPKSDKPDAEYIKAHFFEEGKLTEAQVLRIVKAGTKLLTTEPNLLEIETPATSKNNKY